MHPCLRIISYALLASCIAAPAAAQATIDSVDARLAFAAARSVDRAELTALWGLPLSCPVIFADRATRQAVASHADSGGALRPEHGHFAGRLPDAVGIANYGLDWGGRRWTMVMWPLPVRARDRDRLVAHELFHCLQPALGVRADNPLNAHLDEEQGRLWLRMEWRALEEALMQRDAARRTAIEDALLFRHHRRALFAGSAAEEHALEWNEGLAEYTGLRGAGYPRHVRADRAAVQLADWERRTAFTRGFAYASGPAYGILLDESGAAWHADAKRGEDLGVLLARVIGIVPRSASAADLDRVGARYDLRQVRREERARAERAAALLADHTRRFVEGPVVRVAPDSAFSFSFDPNSALSFRGGTVHRTLRVTDTWGVLDVTAEGAWLARTGGQIVGVVVSAPAGVDRPLRGDGWQLTLAEGWQLVPGARAGDWMVMRKSR